MESDETLKLCSILSLQPIRAFESSHCTFGRVATAARSLLIGCHALPLHALLSDWVDMHPSPPRLYTSAISSCTKALCDVKGDACILMVWEQDVSEAGQCWGWVGGWVGGA